MAWNRRSFPAVFVRLAALACATALALSVAPSIPAGAISKRQVDAAKADVKHLQAKIAEARKSLLSLQQQVAGVTEELLSAQDLYDQVAAQLLATRQKVSETQAALDVVQTRLNARAADVFVNGTSTNLDFILGATSLADLSDRLEFSDVVQQSDADLATQVQSQKNELVFQRKEQQRLEKKQRIVVDTLKTKKAAIDANFRAQQTLVNQIHSDYVAARKQAAKLSKQWQHFLAQSMGIGNASGILKVCPVGQPRGFSDGFGAPRYAGGFHLHAGVDILAPRGTPIYAPFDGDAVRGWNALGGNAVYVYGAAGYVYNAHLDSYGATGHVTAGTVIGYVGDTGDAQGGATHDHFEWHPKVIPSNWPQSAYGYSVIGDAVNPYPLLVAACL